MNWDEQARADALEAAANREPGYYWIRRHEPDWPPAWEVARFVEAWPNIPGHERRGWYVTGNDRRLYEVAKPFSNAWQIGQAIHPCEP